MSDPASHRFPISHRDHSAEFFEPAAVDRIAPQVSAASAELSRATAESTTPATVFLPVRSGS